MADLGRGAKAGVVSGVVAGIILAIGYLVLFTIISDQIKTALQGTTIPIGTTIDALLAFVMIILVVGTFLGTLIAGLILGLIFSVVADKYMTGKSYAMRGIVFGIVLWIIGILFNLGNFYYGTTYVAASVIIGLAASLIYGWLLGTFYGRFGPKTPAMPPPAAAPSM